MASSFKIIFSDAALVVVDKGCGVSVHNEDGRDLLSLLQSDFGKVLPVHRLDKETSGVQILARDPETARLWSGDFEARNVSKIYLGIARGALKAEAGEWKFPISDKGESRRDPAGMKAKRVEALTHFHVLARSSHLSLLEFDLKTGRQHQIRKHCALAGHALVGDTRYGDPKYNQKLAGFLGERMFLHCASLKLRGHVFKSEDPGFAAKIASAP